MHDLAAVVRITPSYRYSSELALCLKLFRKALPRGSSLVVVEGDSPSILKTALAEQVRLNDCRYVALVREPAMVVGDRAFEHMMQALEEHPEFVCVLPSDIRGYKAGSAASYFTLRHFEAFVKSLSGPGSAFMPYDGREPWVFLARPETLSHIALPDDPMTLPHLLPAAEVATVSGAYIHPFIDYYEERREEAVLMVPEQTTSLLDIGCARGRFGEAVKARLGCRVVGIEMNAYESGFATARLDRVLECDFLAADLTERFDCITCLDVIEHVAEPTAFLERALSLLAPRGHLLVSIPNVGHWSIVEDLIAGRWDYLPVGILTVSHLRFFTRRSLVQMIEEAGFKVLEVKGQEAPPPDGFAQDMELLRQRNREVDGEGMSCLGYYVLAQKRP